jgi:pyridinium-3,5-biscarboxylic acid mononucleotide sulfurtransferase
MTRIAELENRVAALGSGVVAFSGGVDSSVVAAVAHRALGRRALAVTAVSPALAEGELEAARKVARSIGIAHETISTAELQREGYRKNGHDRCYFCKTELYESLSTLARRRGYAALLAGANADDAGDWRPGLSAAAEHGVVNPLLEAGVGKEEVRAFARALGVPSAEKAASPCLASRIPYGTAVEPSTLAQVDRAERAVRALGYRVLRVRHFGLVGKVEVGGEELEHALGNAAAVVAAICSAGYEEAEIDPQPFRSGSLNAVFLGRLAAPCRS